MTTFPLTFPNLGCTTSTIRLQRAQSMTTSPFTGQQQIVEHPAAWWEGEISLRATRYKDFGVFKAFLAKLRGQVGSFLYGDPDFLARGAMGVGGTVQVDGAGQTGRALNVKGMTPSTQGILKAGDYVQLGTGGSARLHLVTEDLDSDGVGKGVLNIEPKLRASPANNQAVIIDGAMGVFCLSSPLAEWSAGVDGVYRASISFREIL